MVYDVFSIYVLQYELTEINMDKSKTAKMDTSSDKGWVSQGCNMLIVLAIMI